MRHDKMVRVILQLLRAAGSKARESTTKIYPSRFDVIDPDRWERSKTPTHVYADGVIEDPNGVKETIDGVVTVPTAKHIKKPLRP